MKPHIPTDAEMDRVLDTIASGGSPQPLALEHTGHGAYSMAVHRMEPGAVIVRAASGQIWEVQDPDGEVLGIGGPQPERAWEAAAHFLGSEVMG